MDNTKKAQDTENSDIQKQNICEDVIELIPPKPAIVKKFLYKNTDYIRYIIDIDGFPCEKVTVFKEVGIFDIWERKVKLYHVRLPKWCLRKGKTPSCGFCEREVHGLPFKNRRDDISYQRLCNLVVRVDPNAKHTWGYKGGIIEKNLLKDVGFVSINLESFGCPKVERVLEQLGLQQLRNCDRHTCFKGRKRESCHCSGVEVQAFGYWYEHYLDNILNLKDEREKRARKNKQRNERKKRIFLQYAAQGY